MQSRKSEKGRQAAKTLCEELKTLIEDKWQKHDEGWRKVPGLHLHVITEDTIDKNCFYTLSVAIIVQGYKVIDIGSLRYSYGGDTMIVTSVEIPTSFRIEGACKEEPFISVSLKLDPQLLSELMEKMPDSLPTCDSEPNAFCVAKPSAEIVNAFERLIRLSDNPQHMQMLLPSVLREIHYYALTDGQCANLRALCIQDMPNQRIARVVQWIKEHYKEPLRIQTLAEMSFMAPSTFHAHFKAVTSQSPLQYQKRLRLHEARRLMLYQNYSATAAAFEVGYQSVQQFCREYKRLFGKSPARDIAV